MDIQKDLRRYVIYLTANTPVDVPCLGNHVHIYSASYEVTIYFDANNLSNVILKSGMSVDRDYSHIRLLSPYTQTINLDLGFGRVYDSRAVVTSLPASANTLTSTKISCTGNATTLLSASNANRIIANIHSLKTNTFADPSGMMLIGESANYTTTYAGLSLDPANTISYGYTGNLYACVLDAATQEVMVQNETIV
jgi:hypothetical protein